MYGDSWREKEEKNAVQMQSVSYNGSGCTCQKNKSAISL